LETSMKLQLHMSINVFSQKLCYSNSNIHGPKYTMLAVGKP
jgi:hypothetical protein